MNCDIRIALDADRGEGTFSSEDGYESYPFWPSTEVIRELALRDAFCDALKIVDYSIARHLATARYGSLAKLMGEA